MMLAILPGMFPGEHAATYEDVVSYTYTPSIPDEYFEIHDVPARKQYLIDILLPLVLKANAKISRQRDTLIRIKESPSWFTQQDREIIEDLAEKYRVSTSSYDTMIDELLARVDVLPVSLVLAQAAIESGWGTSRFAVEGNNLFGLRTLGGYGMIPKELDEGGSIKVSVFKDLQASVDYYLWTINTHPEYEELRQIRSRNSRPLDPLALAQGLSSYSEIGQDYIDQIVGVIEYNQLQDYDIYKLQ